MEKYDMIVVGLGWAGLSTAYYYSTQVPGARILGIEQFSSSGYTGTSSFGDTRLFNYTPGFDDRNKMLKDSLEMWKEIEKFSNKKLVYNFRFFGMGDKDDRLFQNAVKELPEDQILNPQQIVEEYPAFENIPDNYIGFITDDAGIIKSKEALDVYRSLWEENKVELKYNTKVTEVSKNHVKTSEGNIYNADHVVVATGPYTGEDFKVDEPNLISIEQEYFELVDRTGLPDLFLELGTDGSFNGLRNGDNFNHYKFARHDKKNYEAALKWAKNRIPSKVEEILNDPVRHECKWWYHKEKLYVYDTKEDGVHYLYGFKGHGFAYMPVHGKIVYDTLIHKNLFKYIK